MGASLSLLASRDLGIWGLELAENRTFSAVGLEAGDTRQPHSSRNGDSSSTEQANGTRALLQPAFQPMILQRVKRLRSGCGVELCVIVEVILDHQIALARGLDEPRDVENANFFAGVFDKSFSLENSGGRRNSGTATPKHVSEKLM
jgi:hypothetical protein